MTRKRQPPKKPTKAVDAPPSEPPEADADATVAAEESAELDARESAEESAVGLIDAAADDAPLEVVLPADLLEGEDRAGTAADGSLESAALESVSLESVSLDAMMPLDDMSLVDVLPHGDDDEGPGLEKAPLVSTGSAHLKAVIEALIFASDKPVTTAELAKAANAKAPDLKPLLSDLIEEYRGRGVELVEVSGGYQFRTSAIAAPFVRDYVSAKPVRLSRAQVETLSIVAYRQPVTRPEIDDIRGVDSGSALKILLDRGLLKILGKKEEAGRPLIYGTTAQFLEFFGLASLRDLPTLREFSELSDESKALFERRSGEPLGDIGITHEELEGETGGLRQAVELEASQAVERVERGEDEFGESTGDADLDVADTEEASDSDADPDADADSPADSDAGANLADAEPDAVPDTDSDSDADPESDAVADPTADADPDAVADPDADDADDDDDDDDDEDDDDDDDEDDDDDDDDEDDEDDDVVNEP